MIVFYHRDCFDGIFAVALMQRAFQLTDSMMYPIQYGEPMPVVSADEEVIFVDFCPSAQALYDLTKVCAKVTVIDHHKTAYEAVEKFFLEVEQPSNLTLLFDDKQSGAGGTWRYLNPDIYAQMPAVIAFAQDYDLWLFELENTRAFIAGFGTLPLTLESANQVLDTGPDACIAIGAPLVAQQDAMVARHVAESWMVDFHGYRVPITNAPRYIGSLVGETLGKDHPFCIIYFDNADMREFSLRSNKKTGVDVQELAIKMGGGGHVNAAGFRQPRPDPIKF